MMAARSGGGSRCDTRIGHRTEFPDGQAGGKEFGAVGQRDGGEVAVAQTQLGIGARESIGPGVQFGARQLHAAARRHHRPAPPRPERARRRAVSTEPYGITACAVLSSCAPAAIDYPVAAYATLSVP